MEPAGIFSLAWLFAFSLFAAALAAEVLARGGPAGLTDDQWRRGRSLWLDWGAARRVSVFSFWEATHLQCTNENVHVSGGLEYIGVL